MSKSLLFLSLLGSTQIMAQTNSSVKKAPQVSKDWSISLSNTTTSNLYSLDSTEHYAMNITSLRASVKTGKAVVSLGTSLIKELQGERDQDLSDFSLSLSRPLYKFNKDIGMRHSLSLKLPTSKNSDERANLQVQLSYTPSVSLSGNLVGNENLSFSYAPYFIAPFHKYKTTTLGTSNNQFIAGNSLGLDYALTDSFSSGYAFSYTRSFKHGGEQRDSYSNTFYASYAFSAKTSATLSYELGGSPLRPDGKETEIKFIDNDEATLSLNIATRF